MNDTPRHLFEERTFLTFKKSLRHAHRIVLFLDYDGTLVPIRPTPEEAVIPPQGLTLVRQLQQKSHISVVIITGRAMNDICSLLGNSVQWIAANHGFHIRGPHRQWIHPQALLFAEQRNELINVLHKSLDMIDGVRIEDKLYTISLHYRNVHPQHQGMVTRCIATILREQHYPIRITRGKKVVELRPDVDWGKGFAMEKVLSLLRLRTRPLVVAIGDDQTDESMFERLTKTDFGICVGKKRHTSARYRVRNVPEVIKLLETICTLHTNERRNKDENTRRL